MIDTQWFTMQLPTYLLHATESAAIACYAWVGRNQEKMADAAATNALRTALNNIEMCGTVVTGEGERDDAPMLYIGEKLGTATPTSSYLHRSIDIAVDPLEGTTICARNMPGALSVIVVSEHNGLLHTPDVYMDKIAVGPGLPRDVVDLDATPSNNVQAIARAKNCPIHNVNVIVLNRSRNSKIISDLLATGARVKLIEDGDISSVLEVCNPNADFDMYCGIGGAPEGVIAAAAVKIMGGQMQCRLLFNDQAQIQRATNMGICNLEKKYYLHEIVPGNHIGFYATGITTGTLLNGIQSTNLSTITNSISIILSHTKRSISISSTTHLNL